MRLVFTDAAREDLRRIGDWIADENPQRALSFIAELETRCAAVVAMVPAITRRSCFQEKSSVVLIRPYEFRPVSGNLLASNGRRRAVSAPSPQQ